MAKHKLTLEQLAAVEDLAKPWGEIVAKGTCGPSGPGLDVDFDEPEHVAAAATRGLARGTLEHLVQQQAQPDPWPTCRSAVGTWDD